VIGSHRCWALSLVLAGCAHARPAADALPAPVVRLLDAGAEPRVPLRYRLAGPQTEDVTMTLTATQRGGPGQGRLLLGGRALASVMSAPAGGDELTSTMRVVENEATDLPGATPELMEKVRALMRTAVGMKVKSRLTTRGARVAAETTLPPGAPADTGKTFDVLQNSTHRNAVLPAEPVGIGARWEIESHADQGGMKVRQVSRFQLRALAGNTVGLDMEIEVTAGPQRAMVPYDDGTRWLEWMHGTGTGVLELDLGHAVPRRAQMTLDQEVAMGARPGRPPPSEPDRMKVIMEVRAGR